MLLYFKRYNSQRLSTIAINSLENNSQGIKPNRLNGECISLKEATTKLTNNGKRSSKRIILGIDEYANIVLLDGRHLLEAYRILGKSIPYRTLDFASPEAKKVFTSHM